MALNNPSSGFFAASEYMVSPLPWVVTGSTSTTAINKHTFHKVSKSLTVTNHAAAGTFLRVGFTNNGVNGVGDNYFFKINGGNTINLDVRVSEVFIRADSSNTISYSLYAGLTTIDAGQMPMLSGSSGSGTGWEGVG